MSRREVNQVHCPIAEVILSAKTQVIESYVAMNVAKRVKRFDTAKQL